VRHYARLIALWPKDLLRPEQQFTKAIEFRGAIYGMERSQPESAKSSKNSQVTPLPKPLDPKAELAKVNALYTLLENRYSKKYPISPAVLKPASNPDHYDLLMADIEAAPNKSWLQAKIDQWKMKIRWQ
jgi:cytochrome b pre-mRNA-processing protein 6